MGGLTRRTNHGAFFCQCWANPKLARRRCCDCPTIREPRSPNAWILWRGNSEVEETNSNARPEGDTLNESTVAVHPLCRISSRTIHHFAFPWVWFLQTCRASLLRTDRDTTPDAPIWPSQHSSAVKQFTAAVRRFIFKPLISRERIFPCASLPCLRPRADIFPLRCPVCTLPPEVRDLPEILRC